MALGLHHMHENRVLHRDLKTQNIFMLGNGRLVLGDLGISKVLEGTMDLAQTCIGTPYYMSPEIFKNKPYNYKSDIWSLGCCLYEMTTLKHAFDANSLNGLAVKIIRGQFPPISSQYSKGLRDLIKEMLATNPSKRPDLDRILGGIPFIKKHIANFFSDIVHRPAGKVRLRCAMCAADAATTAIDIFTTITTSTTTVDISTTPPSPPPLLILQPPPPQFSML
jgi:serine/threonine protein kinase